MFFSSEDEVEDPCFYLDRVFYPSLQKILVPTDSVLLPPCRYIIEVETKIIGSCSNDDQRTSNYIHSLCFPCNAFKPSNIVFEVLSICFNTGMTPVAAVVRSSYPDPAGAKKYQFGVHYTFGSSKGGALSLISRTLATKPGMSVPFENLPVGT